MDKTNNIIQSSVHHSFTLRMQKASNIAIPHGMAWTSLDQQKPAGSQISA